MRTILCVLLMGILVAGATFAADQAPGAPAAPVAIHNPHLGTSTHFAQYWDPATVMPVIAASGLGWIRDEIYWSEVEKTKGVYQVPEKSQKWIDAAQQGGLKIIVCFEGPNALYTDPYDPAAYGAAAAFLATQLNGKVQAIEVNNEPYNMGYAKVYGGTWNGLEGDGSISPWVGRYVTFLNTTAKAVKAANPQMKVIGLGSVAPVNFRQIAMGLVPEVDGITDHPYSFRGVPETVPWNNSPELLRRDGIVTADENGTFASQIRMEREQCAKYNGPKEIWLTEWGWSTYHETKPGYMYAGFTESAQGQYILRRYMECLGLGVDVSCQYCFINNDVGPEDPELNFGMLDAHLKPKPAYAAVQRLAAAMDGCQAKGTLQVKIFPMADRPDTWPIVWDGTKLAAPLTIMWYQFVNAAGRPIVAVWSAERADGDLQPRTAKMEITTGAPVTTIRGYDIWTGESFTVPFTRQGNLITIDKLTVPAHPITLTLQ
jgi:hypothetical protein